ncbi:hypothetical protein D3C74_500800 [compost metagenome]
MIFRLEIFNNQRNELKVQKVDKDAFQQLQLRQGSVIINEMKNFQCLFAEKYGQN